MRRLFGLSIILCLLVYCGQCPGPKPPDPENIKVTVCVTSSLLSNEWCPEVVERVYPVGSQPTATCTVHGKPVPAVRVFVGVLDLMVAEGDWRRYVDESMEEGAYGFRVIIDMAWKGAGTRPYEYASYDEAIAEKIRNKDPKDLKDIRNVNGIMTLVRESGRQFPLFDYNKPREEFWDKIVEIGLYVASKGGTMWWVLVDFCTLKTAGDDKYASMWYCAVQRMMPGVENGVWGEQMKVHFRSFYERAISKINQGGGQSFVEDMNEGDALGWDDAFMRSWFEWSNARLREFGVPKERIVTTVSRNVEAIAALCGFYSPHGIGTSDKITSYYGLPMDRIIPSGDGFWGGKGDCDADGKCGVGMNEAPAIAAKMGEIGAFAYEYFPRGAWKRNANRANVDDVDKNPIRILSKIR